MPDYPVYAEQDVDTRIALHLGINKWDLSYGGSSFYCKCDSLDAWAEYAQRHLTRFGDRVHADMVPHPSWWPNDDGRGFVDNHEDGLWQLVSAHIHGKNQYEHFLNCMANHCPKNVTFGWWLVTATARQKLDIAEDFMLHHFGDPLARVDWDKYVVRVATPDVARQ